MPDIEIEIEDELEDDESQFEDCNGDNCNAEVYPEDPYFATPCGTYCSRCMRRHMKECEICRGEFGE